MNIKSENEREKEVDNILNRYIDSGVKDNDIIRVGSFCVPGSLATIGDCLKTAMFNDERDSYVSINRVFNKEEEEKLKNSKNIPSDYNKGEMEVHIDDLLELLDDYLTDK